MNKGEKMYRRLCVGLTDKGQLVPSNFDINKFIKDNQDKDLYKSLYKYSEKQKKQFDEKGTISGINDVVTNTLVWDLDHKNFEVVRKDAKTILSRLSEYNIDNVEVSFSGNKGLHIEFEGDRDLTVKQFKGITKSIAEGCESFDPKINNPSRIIRLPFSKHQTSGLYKTVLNPDEIDLPVEEIKKIAESKYEPEDSLPKVRIPRALLALKEPEIKAKKLSEEISVDLDLDFRAKPKNLSYWKYALLNGYFPEGTRNYALMVLAATFRAQGWEKVVTYHALKGAADVQSQRFDTDKVEKEEIWEVVNKVFAPTWEGGTYSEDNFPDDLKEYLLSIGVPRQDDITTEGELIEDVSTGFDGFLEYAENIDKYTMKFGIPSIDNKLKIRKGHMIGLVAPPGVGKTSLAVTILNNMSKQGTHCYFGSYDMFKNNVYQKLIQRHSGLSEDELYQAFKDKDYEQIEKFRKILIDNYENVSFCYKVGQSIHDLKRSIQLQEEKVGKPIELVVVDYIELILTDKSDATAASAEAAQGLREIANEGRVVFVLLQPNKMSSKPNEPLKSYNAAKGSSAIAQAVTAMLTAHRPGLDSRNPENDKYFGVDCVKNRNGALFSVDFAWEGRTQTIREMEDIEKEELDEFRANMYTTEEESDEQYVSRSRARSR